MYGVVVQWPLCPILDQEVRYVVRSLSPACYNSACRHIPVAVSTRKTAVAENGKDEQAAMAVDVS